MEKSRIVITGIGVVAPNGIGKEEFWRNCAAGVSGIKPITLFDTSRYRCRYAGEISNFQPEKYLGSKGLRNLDRTTLLALVAAKLAIEDAKLKITDENCNDIGVVLGSTMGSVHSISTFDIESLREGPRYVNPALFPNTVINSPASQISIRFGIKGLNSTIGTGFTASLNALEYAVDMLRLGRVKTLLVGGVEELCIETFNAFSDFRLLFSANGNSSSRMTAKSEMGKIVLGEGSGIVVLETEEAASLRDIRSYGEILAISNTFDRSSATNFQISKVGAVAAIQQAIELSGVTDVHYICPSSEGCEEVEDAALNEVFGRRLDGVQKVSIKSMVGECFSAMGILQLIRGIGAAEKSGDVFLVNTFSQIGIYASVIAQKMGETR